MSQVESKKFECKDLGGSECPSCKEGQQLKNHGGLPAFTKNKFGGQPCGIELVAGSLCECLVCHLFFRHPRVEQRAIDSLYESLPATVWSVAKPRHYWPLILKWMERFSPQKKILDVGCFTADFLAWLPDEWVKMGVELNRRAVKIAEKKHVRILGAYVNDVAGLLSPSEAPSVITMIDVLEHMDEPMDVLTKVRDCLESKGIILIVTGNTASWPFRFLTPDYWYSSLPEHITFYNKKWFQWANEKLGLKLVFFKKLSSEKVNFVQSAAQGMRHIAYVFIKRCAANKYLSVRLQKIAILKKIENWPAAPWWTGAKDHMVVILKRCD